MMATTVHWACKEELKLATDVPVRGFHGGDVDPVAGDAFDGVSCGLGVVVVDEGACFYDCGAYAGERGVDR